MDANRRATRLPVDADMLGTMSAPGFRALFDRALDPMLLADDDARYIDANRAACRWLGMSRAEICRRRVVDLAPPDAREQFDAVWAAFLREGAQQGEYQLQLPDGRVRDIEYSATANVVPGLHLSVIRDVTERKRLEAEREQLLTKVHELARTDPLTGLPNRRAWTERLAEEMQRSRRTGEPLTIAVLDLDDFKALNDTLGHPAGDRLLKDFANRWQGQLREVDLLARVGGDEFSLLLPGCSACEQGHVLRRLLAVMPPGRTVSIGAATWDGEEHAAELLERADRALYEDKRRTIDA